MDRCDLLPMQDLSLRRRLAELIGTVDGVAYDTRHPNYKRVLGQLAQPLGHIYDQTRTDEALEPWLSRYQDACTQAYEVTSAEGASVAVLYEWLGWYLKTMLAGTAPAEAHGMELAEAVMALLTNPQQATGQTYDASWLPGISGAHAPLYPQGDKTDGNPDPDHEQGFQPQ